MIDEVEASGIVVQGDCGLTREAPAAGRNPTASEPGYEGLSGDREVVELGLHGGGFDLKLGRIDLSELQEVGVDGARIFGLAVAVNEVLVIRMIEEEGANRKPFSKPVAEYLEMEAGYLGREGVADEIAENGDEPSFERGEVSYDRVSEGFRCRA